MRTNRGPGLEIFGGRDGSWTEHIVAHCPSLRQGFHPPRWARGAHTQTLLGPARAAFIPPIRWDAQDRITRPDGGTISIQWAGLDAPPGTPVVVILPTITGCGDDFPHLIRALTRRKGRRVVAVCNRRGHTDLPLTAPQVNSMGSTADLVQQLQSIEARCPGAPLYGVGISAGSGLLVRYLGEQGPRAKFRAGIAYCPGYDIRRVFRSTHPLYDRVMTRRLVDFFIHRHAAAWTGFDAVLPCTRARTLTEFHDHQYPLAGYPSRQAYYEHSNPMVVADEIQTPLLIINAADDPVCAISHAYDQLDRMQQISRIVVAFTQRGGHCGFFDGRLARGAWTQRVLVEFLDAIETQGSSLL